MTKKKLFWQIPFLLLLIVGTIFIVRRQNETPYQHFEGFVFGTVFHATYQSEKPLDSLFTAEFNRVDASLSMFNPLSTAARINDNKPVKDDPMFMEVAQLAMKIAADTEGAFDPTVGPLVNMWGFGFKRGLEPSEEAIDSLMNFIGYEKVKILPHCQIEKENPNIALDLSAIAKGYAGDVVAKMLKAQGVKNYMVEIGGEIVVSGVSPKRVPWKIGVTKPNDNDEGDVGEVQHILNITDCGIATSGNYRNFYYRNGKKYAHTIDPKTGMPVQHNILSATVIAADCASADAYSTAFMVMGLEKAQQVLERHPEMKAYFILSTPEGGTTTWMSEGIED